MGIPGYGPTDRPVRDRLDRLQRDAEAFPGLYPFGVELAGFLDKQAEQVAPFEARLRSVWRYIVARVKRFAMTLSVREAAVLDAQDLAQTVVINLIEKDHLWDPGRGKYTTFAEAIIQNVLSAAHEQARAVTGPTNSYSRLKAYRLRERSGTLTRGMRETMRRIEGVMDDFTSYSETHAGLDGGADPDIQALLRALRALDDPIQVWIVVRRYGLFGTTCLSYEQIGKQLRIAPATARAAMRRAKTRLRQALHEVPTHEAL